MSYAKEREIIETRFKELWVDDDGDPLTPVAYDLQALHVERVEAPWVRLSILSGAAEQASVGSPGSNTKRHVGIVAVQINTPLGTGSAASRVLADKIESIFNNVTVENMRFMVVYSAGAAEETSGWSTWTIWCPFTRDEFNA